jgi:hypothetical protein
MRSLTMWWHAPSTIRSRSASVLQGGRVVEVDGFAGQMGRGFLGDLAVRWTEASVCCFAADDACDRAGVSVEHGGCLAVHPFLGGGVAGGVKGRCCVPEVFEHVHEIHDDRDLTLRAFAPFKRAALAAVSALA